MKPNHSGYLLEKIYSSVRDGEYDQATDLILEYIDELLGAGKVHTVDDFLDSINVDLLDVQSSISVLAVTRVDALKLKNRQAFFRKLEKKLSSEHPDRVRALLSNF